MTQIDSHGQVRIISEHPLLDEHGQLAYRGWATSQLLKYRRADVGAANWRIKEWDYYLVNDECYAVALTLSDLGFAGMLSASLLDFEAHTYTTTSELVPLSLGKFGLPETSAEGVSEWKTKRVHMRFGVQGDCRTLHCTFKRFRGEEALTFNGVLDEPPRDTMVIATPWAKAPSHPMPSQLLSSRWPKCRPMEPLSSPSLSKGQLLPPNWVAPTCQSSPK